MGTQYDIFLSYRRKGGYVTAKHLYDLLSRDGYSVSFDIDTLRNGDFDIELLKRIDECTDFIVILNEGALDRTLDPTVDPKRDWLRNELAYALKRNKNVIPVMLDGFTEFPDNLPTDIARVQKKNGPKYDQYYFDDFYRKLKDVFLETPSPTGTGNGCKSWNLKLVANMDCAVFIDGIFQKYIDAGNISLFTLNEGSYRIECVSKSDSNIKVTKDYTLDTTDIIDTIDLKDVYTKINQEREQSKYVDVITKLLNEYEGPLSWPKTRHNTVTPPPSVNEAGFLICKNNKYGVANKSGEIIIPCVHQYVSYSNGMYATPLCIYDSQGNIVLKIEEGDSWKTPSYIGNTSTNGLTPIIEKGVCRYIDRRGNTVIKKTWQDGTSFIDGIAAIKENGVWNFINEQGDVVVSQCYEEVCFAEGSWLSEGLIGVKRNGKFGFVNNQGEEVVPIKFNFITTPFADGVAVVSNKFRSIFIDHNGKTVANVPEDPFMCRSDGLLPILNNDRSIGMISSGGTLIIPTEYEDDKSYTPNFSEGLLRIKKNGKFGFVDKGNNTIINFTYDIAGDFCNGFAYAKQGNSVGFINRQGKFTIVRNIKNGTEQPLTNNTVPHLNDTLNIHGICCPGYNYATDDMGRLGVVNDRKEIVVPCLYHCDDYIKRDLAKYGVKGTDYYSWNFLFDGDLVVKYKEIAMPIKAKRSVYSMELKQIDIWSLTEKRKLVRKESRLIKGMLRKNLRYLLLTILLLGMIYVPILSPWNVIINWAIFSTMIKTILIAIGTIGIAGTILLTRFNRENWIDEERGMFSSPMILTFSGILYVLGWMLPPLPMWLNIIRIIGCIIAAGIALSFLFISVYNNLYSKIKKGIF